MYASIESVIFGERRFHYYMPVLHDSPYGWAIPSVALFLYFLLLLVGPRWVKTPYSLEKSLRYWNLFLSTSSFVMFLGLFLPSLFWLLESGIMGLLTLWPAKPLWSMFTVWVFAWTKYLELVDTVFLILRKKPLSFLHWYHHTTVLLYTWYAVSLQLPCGIQFAVVNSFVHTIMYGYFFLTSIGRRPVWGHYVTQLQLAQMIIGFLIMTVWAKYYFWDEQVYGVPYFHGSRKDAIIITITGMVMYCSYFLLFAQFYINRFLSSKRVERKKVV